MKQNQPLSEPMLSPVPMICMQNVERTEVSWLWYPYIPFGKLIILQGNPGEGKTYFAMQPAAACTAGKALPNMTAAVRSLLFIGRVKNDPTTRVLTHEKSSLAPPGKSLAFSLDTKEGFSWIGKYAITAD